MSDTTLLFVYGTLKRGKINNYFISSLPSSYREPAQFAGYMLKNMDCTSIFIPHLYRTGNVADVVAGEIWAVATSDIPMLDVFETGYTRTRIGRYTHPNGSVQDVYTYISNLAPDTEWLLECPKNDKGQYEY